MTGAVIVPFRVAPDLDAVVCYVGHGADLDAELIGVAAVRAPDAGEAVGVLMFVGHGAPYQLAR